MQKPIHDTLPPEILHLVRLCKSELLATEVWLFGSRARGDHAPDSDFDILAILPDDAPTEIDSPSAIFWIRRAARANADLLTVRQSDFVSSMGVVNTMSYVVANEGVRIDV